CLCNTYFFVQYINIFQSKFWLMKKPIYIPQLHLCIINRVRRIRLELGLSQRDVSRILYPESSSNLLGGIEGTARTDMYTDENLNKLANAFTELAQQQGNPKNLR